jgi:hypothetical protein
MRFEACKKKRSRYYQDFLILLIYFYVAQPPSAAIREWPLPSTKSQPGAAVLHAQKKNGKRKNTNHSSFILQPSSFRRASLPQVSSPFALSLEP